MNLVLVISNPVHRITTVSLKQLTSKEEQMHLMGSVDVVGDEIKDNLNCFSTVKVSTNE